jgi:hypothetical protein
MGKGFQPPNVRRTAEVPVARGADIHTLNFPPVEIPEIIEDPNFKPWVIKHNGRRYETVNPWHVSFYDDFERTGKFDMHIYRINPDPGRAIEVEGNGMTMWRDEAINFCLRKSYLTPIVGIKLTANEQQSLLGAAAFAGIILVLWLLGY